MCKNAAEINDKRWRPLIRPIRGARFCTNRIGGLSLWARGASWIELRAATDAGPVRAWKGGLIV